MNTKTCTRCKEEKPNTEEFFRPYYPSEIKQGRSGLHVACRTCLTKAHTDWGRKNAKLVNNSARKQRHTLADWVDTFKDVPCTDCGVKYPPYVMDFDHLPEYIKSAGVPRLVNMRRPKSVIKAEIDKCEVVCANCHRLRTKERGQWGGRFAEETTS
jgi:hypothetical protein